MTPDDRTHAETQTPSPDDAVLGAAVRQVVEALSVSPGDVALAYEQAHGRVHDAEPTAFPERTALRGSMRRLRGRETLRWGAWYALGGAIAGVLAVAGIWRLRAPLFHSTRLATVSSYVTANGERANVTLPDGSKVAISVGSRLDVPADYAAGNRTVRLTGEALFTVQHHARAPFTVIAGGTTTRVLGTSFLVRHYGTDRATTVAVRDGRVAVRAAQRHPVVLAASQQVRVDAAGTETVQDADLAEFTFASGVLTLESVPFPEAIVELDRWYDADIRLGDPVLETQRVTGECAAGSLTDLTSLLELTFNVRVVRHGRVLTLFPR